MAKKRPAESFAPGSIAFEFERERYELLRLDPNRMEAMIRSLETGLERKLPFAHLPKHVKKTIRPLD